MEFDFDSLGLGDSKPQEVEPRAILRSLPVREKAINDLWDGQAQALAQWHQNRTREDNLILLNTGAGKTIVGLLIAESLRRETNGNVLYLCANNELVKQVSAEADRLGLEQTTRISGAWSNDKFERGKAICITNYQSLLNTRTTFKGEKRPDALVLDDAHVAEGIIRDQFTLHVSKHGHSALHEGLLTLIRGAEMEASWKAKIAQVIGGSSSYSSILLPPNFGKSEYEKLNQLLSGHLSDQDLSISLPLGHLYGKWPLCTFCVSQNAIEIAPPALPTRSYTFFSAGGVRRVYLSATLDQVVDFSRAFGRKVIDPIRPSVDAGNGERLIMFSEQVGGEGVEGEFVVSAAAKGNLLLAVPSHARAERWKDVARVPTDFSDALAKFKTAKSGVLLLVGRYDGLDLPNESCRLMAIDSVPRGTNLLERFVWEYLDLQGDLRSRIATRLTQLFGRIIRGRVDHGTFLVLSRSLNNWLGDDRNISLLPELLRNQIKLGLHIHEKLNVKDVPTAIGLIDSVLRRDEGWVQFYARWSSSFVVDEEIVKKVTDQQAVIGAVAADWVDLWSALWVDTDNATIEKKRSALEDQIPALAAADNRLAGWLNIWLGETYALSNDEESAADHFGRARGRLLAELPLPRVTIVREGLDESKISRFARHFMELLRGGIVEANNRVRAEDMALAALEGEDPGATKYEEALRMFGFCLGFVSSRPDNELTKGPDVLWFDEHENSVLGLEAKTEKTSGEFNKKEVGQALQHLIWIGEQYAQSENLGLVLVSDASKANEGASPTKDLMSVGIQEIRALLAAYRDLRTHVRTELGASRLSQISQLGIGDEWSLRAVMKRLKPQPLV